MPRQTLIGLLCAALAVSACGGGSAPDRRQAAESKPPGRANDVVQLANSNVDIMVETLARKSYQKMARAPGEVKLNAYRSAQVAPRIAAQIVARHARLGDTVEKGQALASLSSVEVATAQGALVAAQHEWSRLRRLGKSVVGEKRYVEARVAYQNARATLAAYGLRENQIKQVETGSGDRGRFDLIAPVSGTVLSDDFIVGEYVNPGRTLFLVADMRTLWVEAQVDPATARAIKADSQVRVQTDNVEQTGRVVLIQPSAQISTRTVGIRAEIPRDPDHPLYPGDFVTVSLPTGMSAPLLAVPEGALVTLPDDAWAVFVRVAPDKYRQQEVQLGQRLGAVTEIKGIEPGTEVVTQGAFYLNSELGKSDFEDDD